MTRPLWELWLLPGVSERRVGLYLRMHHAIADGIAGVAAIGALLDFAADAPQRAYSAWHDGGDAFPHRRPAGDGVPVACSNGTNRRSGLWSVRLWAVRP
jgi:Wax ester synthase-like Acyl-CoA acyltransferase domain